MGWRTIFITNPCRLSIKDSWLVVEPKDAEATRIPLMDISAIVIETPQCLLTSALLYRLADEGVALLSCDATHIPNGLFAPFASHSRHSKTARAQWVWSEPFRKRCWQKITKSKIENQAKVLELIGEKDGAKRLRNIASKTASGDSANCEAQAAGLYWQWLFDDFVRGGICTRNSALNYGYAILRGAVARSLCGSGFIPAFGLHHANELNAFNLADDIIEPFRPFVDMLVWRRFGRQKYMDELSRGDKAELVALLGDSCFVGYRHESILNAADIASQSLMKCSFEKDASQLLLPEFDRL